MRRLLRHRRLAAGAALTAAAVALGGCTPKDYGADFPQNFAGLNTELIAFQNRLHQRLPKLRGEAFKPSLSFRRELRDYQDRAKNYANRLSQYNKPKKVGHQANSLTGSLNDETQTLGMLRDANRAMGDGKNEEGDRRFARASLTQLTEAVHAVDAKRPVVARIGRELAR